MGNRVYEEYKGMPCVAREIDPTDWTWTYVYQNKDASKNLTRMETLNKNLASLNERLEKNKAIIDENLTKFLKLIKIDDATDLDFYSNQWDTIKGTKTARNRYIKATEATNEINSKIKLINEELKEIEESGFVEFVEVKTKEMVYAYDMQNYVRLHPEKFNNKK